MKYNKKHIILTGLFPVFWLMVKLFGASANFIETYYSNGIFSKISHILRMLFGWIPFSVGDAIVIFLIIKLIYRFFKLIRRKFKGFLNDLLELTSTLSVIYFCFYLFWGMNYFREPLYKNLDLEVSKYNTKELVSTTKFIIKKLNKTHLEIAKNDTILIEIPYTNEELFDKATNGYFEISKTYPQLKYQKKSVKKSLLSLPNMYSGTSGYINPITNEAQINSLIPRNTMPLVICHEMAHQIGWNAENEANFVGYLASIYNNDIYFKYSGYRMAFSYLISEVKKHDKDSYKQLWKSVNKGVIKDFVFKG